MPEFVCPFVAPDCGAHGFCGAQGLAAARTIPLAAFAAVACGSAGASAAARVSIDRALCFGFMTGLLGECGRDGAVRPRRASVNIE